MHRLVECERREHLPGGADSTSCGVFAPRHLLIDAQRLRPHLWRASIAHIDSHRKVWQSMYEDELLISRKLAG